MDLLQTVVQDVPEAPLMTVRDALRWAEFRLCQDGNAWIVDASVTPEGAILAPEGTHCVRVLTLHRSDRLMAPGIDYEQLSPESVSIHRASGGDTFTARVAVKPTSNGDLPDSLRRQHFETLRHGATHRLLLLPQPWRNVEKAEYHETHFTAGINDAYRFSIYGQHRNARVKKRRFV